MTKRNIQKKFFVTLTVSARTAEEVKREIGAIQYDYEDATDPNWDPNGFSIVSLNEIKEIPYPNLQRFTDRMIANPLAFMGGSGTSWELDRLEGKEL